MNKLTKYWWPILLAAGISLLPIKNKINSVSLKVNEVLAYDLLLYLPPILAASKDDVQCEEISGSDSESPMEVVFVPSNFKTSEEMITYGDTVYQIVENWEQHKPLNNELVKIIMLTKEKSNLSC